MVSAAAATEGSKTYLKLKKSMPAVEAIINASAILFESTQSCTAASMLPVSRASFALVVVFRQTRNKSTHYRPSSSRLLKPDSLDTIEHRNTMWLWWRLLRVFHLRLLAYSDSNNKFDYPSRRKPSSRYRLDTTTFPERRAGEFA
uniref:Uncharacterized protein n=1 Tax=Glossina palpalis gambiensis TaxID=67801 RepID=A0A1B0C7V9_9MUSC